MGVATFVFDSFIARDNMKTVNDQSQLGGSTVGYNAQAHIEAQKELRELVTTVLKLK